MNPNVHLWPYLAQFFLEGEMFQTKVVEKIKTHILLLITHSENRALLEIIWKYTVESGRPQMTYGACALYAGYQRLQTRTQNIQYLLLSTAKMFTRTRINVTSYYIACFVVNCVNYGTQSVTFANITVL